jgi:hypothetical protein
MTSAVTTEPTMSLLMNLNQPTDEESEEEDASLIWDDEHEENTDQSEVDATSDSDMESDLESVCT